VIPVVYALVDDAVGFVRRLVGRGRVATESRQA